MAPNDLRNCMQQATPYLLLVVFIATLGPLLLGFHLAELNAPQDVITCKKNSLLDLLAALPSNRLKWFGTTDSDAPVEPPAGYLPSCIPMSELAFSTVSSIFTIGGLLGALLAGPLSSHRGRSATMRMAAVVYAIGGALESLAPGIVVLAIGRLISGLAAGMVAVTVPLYISEIAPKSQRGVYGAMTQLTINVGILLSQILGYYLSYGIMWRWILAIGSGIGVAQAIGLFAVPESPVWLAMHSRTGQAVAVLQRLRGRKNDIRDEIAAWNSEASIPAEEQGLLAQHVDHLPPSSRGQDLQVGFFQVVTDPEYRPAIIAVVGIMFAQQFCGVNSIIMYSVSLLEDMLPVSSALLTILVSLANVMASVLGAPLLDQAGRKSCLMVSIVGQGASSLVLAFSILHGVKVASAISIFTFVISFAVGLGPVPFILASELVGPEAVGAIQSLGLATSYAATFLIAQFFPIVNTTLNQLLGGAGWVYFLFAGFSFAWAMFAAFYVPETKGKKDMDEVWGRTRRLD